MESCDKHDGAIVIYETRGRTNTVCPMCEMSDEVDSLAGALERMTDERDDAKGYAEDLESELGNYTQSVPSRNPVGRKFR